jgi:hypothetical protein
MALATHRVPFPLAIRIRRALLNEEMNQEREQDAHTTKIWNELGSVSVSLTFQSGKSYSNSVTPSRLYEAGMDSRFRLLQLRSGVKIGT